MRTNKYEKMMMNDYRKSQNSDQGTIMLASIGIGAIFGAAINALKKRAFFRGAESMTNIAKEMYDDELENQRR